MQASKYKYLIICLIFLSSVFIHTQAENLPLDSLLLKTGQKVSRPVYVTPPRLHKPLYYKIWGNHYRQVYFTPVSIKSIRSNTLFEEAKIMDQISALEIYLLEDRKGYRYFLKPIGGASSFITSKFFQKIYNQEESQGTYLDDFILDAYTIIHPYLFLTSEYLAFSAQLNTTDNHQLFEIAALDDLDTTVDKYALRGKMMTISPLPNDSGLITDFDSLLQTIQTEKFAQIDREAYIRSRIFDMLIGDWNKVPENWQWLPSKKGDTLIYTPYSIDRTHAFPKVEKILFKELLDILGVGFITNYENRLKDVKKFNTLSFPSDMALTQGSTLDEWRKQAQELVILLTDTVIEKAFERLPQEVRNKEIETLKTNLKERKRHLEEYAETYYWLLQKYPVITATHHADQLILKQDSGKVHIKIINKETNSVVFDKTYTPKHTHEIWIYGLDGDDTFQADEPIKGMNIKIVGGKGQNEYQISKGGTVTAYESKSEKKRLKSTTSTRLIFPNNESALKYDYQHTKYNTLSITPIGIYDSDLGFKLGTSVSYTIYGFKRAPYSRFHQISYNFGKGFSYQGIFPSYDQRKSLHLLAYVGSPAYFSNFFGFGNNTEGYKYEEKKYNRVNINKYMLMPALYYNLTKDQVINFYGVLDVYKVVNPKDKDRLINQYFEDDNSVFATKYFGDLGVAYEMNKKMPHFVSLLKMQFSTGWNINLQYPKRNFAYVSGYTGINLKLNKQITFATQVKGTALFSDDYEFYQAATTELRGYRDNRYIGKRSLYQYSDIRFDMGDFHNTFAPIGYGVFVGVDYGRVWYPKEYSERWHFSYGFGLWMSLFRKLTGKFSLFGSKDGSRFSFQLGMGF